MSVAAVVVAAGRGLRFGRSGSQPKQFRVLKGQPLLFWPLRTFEQIPAVQEIVLVVSSDRLAWSKLFVRKAGLRKVSAIVRGGKERSDSVRAGLGAVSSIAQVILIHDAARPLVSAGAVKRVIAAARRSGAALAGWPVPDTLKFVRGSSSKVWVRKTVPRDNLWLAQTPQGFRRDVAKTLFVGSKQSFTDDAQAAERLGYRVEVVPGEPWNIKVTRPEDIKICKALMKSRIRRLVRRTLA